MNKWDELYNRNKKLDNIFNEKYLDIEPKMFEKNCIEQIVEICELANEAKIFKYWTVKKMDKWETLEELADCLLMNLYFFGYFDIEYISIENIEVSDDILICFNEVIKLSTILIDKGNTNLVRKIFTYLLHIGFLLNFNEDEIIDACYKKIIKNEERLSSNY